MRPLQSKNRIICRGSAKNNPIKSRSRKDPAGRPEYVSTRHRRYSLRQGRSRCPFAARQKNRAPLHTARTMLPV